MARGSVRMLQSPFLSDRTAAKGRCCNFIQISGNPFRPRLFTHLLQSLFNPRLTPPNLTILPQCFRLLLYSPPLPSFISCLSVELPRGVLSRGATVLSRPRNRSRVIYSIFGIHPVFIFIPGTLYTWLISQQG